MNQVGDNILTVCFWNTNVLLLIIDQFKCH